MTMAQRPATLTHQPLGDIDFRLIITDARRQVIDLCEAAGLPEPWRT